MSARPIARPDHARPTSVVWRSGSLAAGHRDPEAGAQTMGTGSDIDPGDALAASGIDHINHPPGDAGDVDSAAVGRDVDPLVGRTQGDTALDFA